MQISQMTSAPLPWLSILVALPALGALMLAMVPALRRAGRTFALILSLEKKPEKGGTPKIASQPNAKVIHVTFMAVRNAPKRRILT